MSIFEGYGAFKFARNSHRFLSERRFLFNMFRTTLNILNGDTLDKIF